MSPRTVISLVARREITTRMRSKPLIWTTIIMVLAIIGGSFATSLLAKDAATPTTEIVGVLDPALSGPLESAAALAGTLVESHPVAPDAVEAELVDGTTVAVIGQSTPGILDVTVHEELAPELEAMMGVLAQQLALDAAVTSLGGDPAAVNAEVLGATPTLHVLEPASSAPEVNPAKALVGMLAGVLIFTGIMTTGQLVSQGVVEEKSSRVVELLLSTIRPWQLIAGKVLGIGVVGLVQIGLLVGAGAGSAAAFDLLAGQDIQLGSAAIWIMVWFLLGYAMYATMLGALSSLVSRQEDVGSIISPVILLLMVPYIIGVTIAPWDPDSPIVLWLSMFPLFSPLLMLIRIAIDSAPAWQLALSVGLSVATIAFLVVLAGKIYSRAVMRTGARLSLREVLKG